MTGRDALEQIRGEFRRAIPDAEGLGKRPVWRKAGTITAASHLRQQGIWPRAAGLLQALQRHPRLIPVSVAESNINRSFAAGTAHDDGRAVALAANPTHPEDGVHAQ